MRRITFCVRAWSTALWMLLSVWGGGGSFSPHSVHATVACVNHWPPSQPGPAEFTSFSCTRLKVKGPWTQHSGGILRRGGDNPSWNLAVNVPWNASLVNKRNHFFATESTGKCCVFKRTMALFAVPCKQRRPRQKPLDTSAQPGPENLQTSFYFNARSQTSLPARIALPGCVSLAFPAGAAAAKHWGL